MLWGESLGTAVAIALAAEKPVSKLILDAPFTSAADLAAAIYWFLPVRLLMRDTIRRCSGNGRREREPATCH